MNSAAPQFDIRPTQVVFAALIACMTYIFGLSGGNLILLMVAQGLFVFWTVFVVAVNRENVALNKGSINTLLILAAVLVSNVVVNMNSLASLNTSIPFVSAHIVGILMFAFAAIWATSELQPSYILKCLAWMLLPIIVLAIAVGSIQEVYGRATPFGVHPNWWGEVAFGFVLCSLALRRVLIRSLFVSLGFLLMYMVQSRGALLGALAAVMTFWAMHYRPLNYKAMRNLALVGVAALIGLLIMFASGIWVSIVEFIFSEVLFLDDPNRGIDSDLTGRIDGYLEAAAIFLENPIFGQGFDTLLDVHNGFLRWAGEGGLILLGVMIYLMVSAMKRTWRCRDDWGFAVIFGIATYLLTYPRALNLNLVGLLFFLAIFAGKTSGESSPNDGPKYD